ncbi:MAG TPA: ROK family transcriptional regulator [Burkholderiales bacterium]|jgi:predicted NBD/HSP70 family sugar kinase|nr:ROK family transcriptional regulator [Burkholderiales bacterium]
MVINNSLGSAPSDLRRQNRSVVLRAIAANNGVSRTQLAQSTGLSLMAITRITRELIDAKLIAEGSKFPTGHFAGRQYTALEIRPSGAYVFGIAVSASNQCVALCDANGHILREATVRFDNLQDAERTISEMAGQVGHLIDAANIDRRRVLGIGVAISGFVDSPTGTIVSAPYLGWGRVELARVLEKLSGLPVVVENIANALNVAEVEVGVCSGKRDVLLLRSATAIGASLIANGQVVRGASCRAGLVGYMPHLHAGKVSSRTGTTLNAVASGWAVLSALGIADADHLKPEMVNENTRRIADVADRVANGDKDVIAACYDAGYRLGEALSAFCLFLDPKAVILAGAMARISQYVDGVNASWSANPLHEQIDLLTAAASDSFAAGYLAVRAFLLSPQLELEPLRDAA